MKTGGYTYKLSRSIDEVNSDDWDKICQNPEEDLFMDQRFISTVESTMSGHGKFWHVIFYDNENAPAACASLCRFGVDPFVLTGGYISRVLRSILPSFPALNILFCGLPVSAGQSHLRFAPHANHDAVIKMLDRILQDLARSENCRFIVFKEFGPESCEKTNSLKGLGYRRGESLPMYEFDRRFPGFAEYCSALRSQYRKNIRRSMRKFGAMDFKIVRLTDPAEIRQAYVPEVHKLYEAVVSRSEHKLEVLPLEFFHELSARFSGHISCTFVYRGDRVVAFNWALYSNASYYFLFGGLDYELNHSADVYFNRMYNALDNALKHGSPVIRLGQTAGEFKTNLGCIRRPLYVYIKGASKLSNYLLHLFFRVVFPAQKHLPDRNPFRQ